MPAHGSSKVKRDSSGQVVQGGYTDTTEERADKTFAFLRSLRFSRPLKDLRDHPARNPCPKCDKRRQYYCYDCLVVTNPESHPPPLSLPVKVHVVLHPNETRGKSTTLPIATVSEDVTIHVYPTVPELDPATTLVLYPSPTAVEISEIQDLDKITSFVFVDSTWQQSRCIATDQRVANFRHVKLSGITSLFWRFQDKDPEHLATVEAIYHSLRQLIEGRRRKAAGAPPSGGEELYKGEVDDLLYYYINQYISVQQNYQGADRHFTGKHFEGYVQKAIDWESLLGGASATADSVPDVEPVAQQPARPQPPASNASPSSTSRAPATA